jgi:hypothetical protein
VVVLLQRVCRSFHDVCGDGCCDPDEAGTFANIEGATLNRPTWMWREFQPNWHRGARATLAMMVRVP